VKCAFFILIDAAEVRLLDSGMRAWQAKHGEHYLQTTGRKSGLWRRASSLGSYLTEQEKIWETCFQMFV
jgi:hypothetical protein